MPNRAFLISVTEKKNVFRLMENRWFKVKKISLANSILQENVNILRGVDFV